MVNSSFFLMSRIDFTTMESLNTLQQQKGNNLSVIIIKVNLHYNTIGLAWVVHHTDGGTNGLAPPSNDFKPITFGEVGIFHVNHLSFGLAIMMQHQATDVEIHVVQTVLVLVEEPCLVDQVHQRPGHLLQTQPQLTTSELSIH